MQSRTTAEPQQKISRIRHTCVCTMAGYSDDGGDVTLTLYDPFYRHEIIIAMKTRTVRRVSGQFPRSLRMWMITLHVLAHNLESKFPCSVPTCQVPSPYHPPDHTKAPTLDAAWVG